MHIDKKDIERTEIGIGKLRFDVVAEDCVYIKLNCYVYYIDDSTNERIIKKWKDKN